MKIFKIKKTKRSPQITNRSSRSASINSYYRSSNSLAQSQDRNRLKDHTTRQDAERARKNISISRVLNTCIVGAIVLLMLIATTLSTNPTIQFARDDVVYQSPLVYQQGAREILESSITNRSKLLFRSQFFEEAMSDAFPEFSSVVAVVPLGGRDLSVLMSSAQPLVLLPMTDSQAQQGSIYIITSAGILVKADPEVIDIATIPTLRFANPLDSMDIGIRLLTSVEVEILQLLEQELQTMTLQGRDNLRIKEVLFNVADGQMEIRIEGFEFFIKISAYSDGAEQVGAMRATLQQLNSDSSLPSRYIDVRVPGRVFVL